MAFHHYQDFVIIDAATGRPLMGVPVKVIDAETDAPVQAYRDEAPITLISGAYGQVPGFQTEDTTHRVRLEAGARTYQQWAIEVLRTPGAPAQGATIIEATAEALPAGAAPTVTLGGSPQAQTITFGIPAGAPGDPGTGTGAGGSSALATAPRTVATAPEATTWLGTFQPGHGAFDNFTGAPAGEPDTEDYIMGTQSLKLTSRAGLASARLNGLNLDLTGRNLVIWAKFDTLPGDLTVYAGPADLSAYWTWTIASQPEGVRQAKAGQWVQYVLPIEAGWAAGTPDRAQIETVMVRTMSTGPSQWHLQGIGHSPVSTRWPKGFCAITFDDGHGSLIPAARQVLSPRGLRATSFMIPDAVGAWGGYLTEAEVLELHRVHGWDMQAHGADNYTRMTPAALRAEWTATKEWFIARGLPAPEHLAYPFGAFNAEVADVARQFYATARSIDLGIEAFPPAAPMAVKGITGIGSAPDGIPVATANDYISDAAAGGHAVVLVFHQIVAADPAEAVQAAMADLAAVADHALATGIQIGTYADLWA